MNAVAVVEQSIATFALHALWQVPLLAAASWCAVRIGRPQARVAYVIWVATLVVCVVLPVCSTIAARRAALAAERNAQVAFSYEPPASQGDLKPMERQAAWKRLLRRHVNAREGLQPFTVAIPRRWALFISCGWLLAIAFFSAQLLIGWVRVRALVRAATDEPLPHAMATALQQQCDALHMTVPVARLHEAVAGPLLAGVVQPVLLVPAASADKMDRAEIVAVLAHELAHLRRCDPMMHAACSLLLLPVCFHPAAWWAARCVRHTREMACDAEAAKRMGSPADYAWALLQIAERISHENGHAATSSLFSNGLFGAGLQLFTNRGAMEERMQMLMNGHRLKGKGRAVRVAACVSLATAAVVAATMLQIQPTLAAEQSHPQAATTPSVPLASKPVAPESEPALISGDHAREQLRRAHRQLTQAESQVTNADDRKKIEGAQQAIAAAEQALDAADGPLPPRIPLDLSGLDQLDAQFKDFKVPDVAALKLQMEFHREAMEKLQAQMNSPEWKAQMQRMQMQAVRSMKAAQTQRNSPEFKAQMEAARKFDSSEINAIMAEARKQQEKGMEQLRSGAMQRQIDQARYMARVEPAPVPSAPPVPTAAASASQPAKPLQIKPGAIKILTKVDPTYPAEQKKAGTQGAVLLHVLIDEQGRVEDISTVNTPDKALAVAALDAVRQWTFQPYLLNGSPISVETTITVNFSLVP